MERLVHYALSNAVAATVLAVLPAVAGRMLRRPALTHALWLLVLLKLFTPPLFSVALEWPSFAGNSTPASLPVVAADPGPDVDGLNDFRELPLQAPETKPPPAMVPSEAPSLSGTEEVRSAHAEVVVAWEWIVAGLWVCGSACWLGLAIVRLARFRRLLRTARFALPEIQERVNHLAASLGLTTGLGVWFVSVPICPLLWALWGKPRLVLPDALWQRLREDHQDALLVHELAHLRRRDHWVRILELLALGVYWWHPVVWWAHAEIQEAEEECCDAWVLWALPASARAYAEALLETASFLSRSFTGVPLGASGNGHFFQLKRRVTMILCGTKPRALSWAGCGLVIALGIILLPLLPTLAQTPSYPAPPPGPGLAAAPGGVAGPGAQAPASPGQDVFDGRMSPETIRQLLKQLEQTRSQLLQTELRLQRALEQLEKSNRTPDVTINFSGRPTATSTEQRLQLLEQKFDALLKELKSPHRPNDSSLDFGRQPGKGDDRPKSDQNNRSRPTPPAK